MTTHTEHGAEPPDLASLGWDAWFDAALGALDAQGLQPARVAIAHNYLYQLYTDHGEVMAEVAGKLRHQATGGDAMPVVGDWVAVRSQATGPKVTIEAILPRRSCFSRKAAGEPTRRQLVAANIDTVFLVCGLDGDFNPRRIERYLVAIHDSGAAPVLVLNKADLRTDADPARDLAALAPGTPTHVISCLEPDGTAPLRAHLAPGRTIALLGSSGAGKSTIINRLLGSERQRTREVRSRDSRGRHTTTQRELIMMPDGGLLIDTPGMRELQLWDSPASIDDAFEDIDRLAADCRFRDCAHEREPGCAVRAAVETGQLSSSRLGNFHGLRREGHQLQLRRDELARLEEQRRGKTVHRAMRHNRLTDKP